jgi:hypothetical protein
MIFINTFLVLSQHVSASNCHHQGVVVSSEATQAVCMLDVYGLRPVQSGQLSRDVTKWLRLVTSLDAFVDCFIKIAYNPSVTFFLR